MKPLEVLSQQEVIAIHTATLQILDQTGIRLGLPSARELLLGAGCTLKNGRVCLPPELVEGCLASCPSTFSLRGRGGETMTLGDGSLHWHNTGGAHTLYDPEKGNMIRKLAIFSFILLLAACSAGNQAAKLDTEQLIGSRDLVTHIRMLEGSTGEARVFPPGPVLDAALDFIETLDASRSDDQGPRAGYLYWIAGYREGGEAFRLTFGSEIVTVDGVRYQLDRDVSKELDALYALAPYGNLLDQAMASLAAARGVPIDAIFPLSVEPHTFPDASLGVPQEGMSYAQVETPGYIFTLSVEGEKVTYHAAQNNIVLVPD